MIVASDIEPPFPLDTFNMYFQFALGIFKKVRISPLMGPFIKPMATHDIL